MLGGERVTALTCLEQDHFAVARASLDLAQTVEHLLDHSRGLTDFERAQLKHRLVAFRAAASRVV